MWAWGEGGTRKGDEGRGQRRLWAPRRPQARGASTVPGLLIVTDVTERAGVLVSFQDLLQRGNGRPTNSCPKAEGFSQLPLGFVFLPSPWLDCLAAG